MEPASPEERVETNCLMQSSVPAPPIPGLVTAALVQAADSSIASSILPLPRSTQPAADGSAESGRSLPANLQSLPGRSLKAVGPFLAEALEERLSSYRKELRRCQEEFSEEAVHELRVATRRLLAQLVLLSCVTPSTGLERARPCLKRRIAALGDLRDTQVLLAFIDEQAVRFPELEPLHGWLRRREARLAKSAAKKVTRLRTKKLGKWIAAITENLAASAGNGRARKQLASDVVRAMADAFAEVLKRRQAIDLADLGTVHQTRVAFKRFRYIVEALSPDLTGLTKRQLRALAYYQRRMGIIQDLEVMKRCVEKFIHDHKTTGSALRPFCRYLRQRRNRALRSFLKSADRLVEFWPISRLAAPGHLPRTQEAA